MTKSIIPWHVFEGAVATMNSQTRDLWLKRWRFMDVGVILSDTHIHDLQVPNTISSPFLEKSEIDDCDTANKISQFNNFN